MATSVQRPPAAEAKSAPRLSIVVLPFSNLSNDPDQEYFADGITDDLTSDLSRISGSFVIARTTAFTYKGKPIDVKQIGRELGVRYVLEGSVRRTGDQVRVNAQLIDAESGAHLWADQFDTNRANLAEAQSEITGRLAWTLNIALLSDASRRIEHENAVDPDARDLVMRGWAWWYGPQSPKAATRGPRSIRARIGDRPALYRCEDRNCKGSRRTSGQRMEQQLVSTRCSATRCSASRTVALRSHRERSEPANGLRYHGVSATNAESLNRITDSLREGDHTRSQFRVGKHAARLDAALPGQTWRRDRSEAKKACG